MNGGRIIALGLRGVLLLGIIWALLQGRLDYVGILGVSVIASAIVGWIQRRFFGPMGIYLDVLFALLIVFNNLFGLVLDYYHTVPGWDIATHYTTSLFLAVSALVVLERGYSQMLKQVPKLAVVFAVTLFALGLGGLWEIGEFASDYLRGTDFQQGLTNTMQDLIVDLAAGIVVGSAWAWKRK